jgi:hypothetical protein
MLNIAHPSDESFIICLMNLNKERFVPRWVIRCIVLRVQRR